MKIKRATLSAILLAMTLMVGGLPTNATHAEDFNPQPDPPGFGMFGLVNKQTARLSIVATGVDEHNPPADLPGPWRVTLNFFNGDGNVIARSIQTLELGKAVSLDYAAPALPMNLRVRIRAGFSIEPDASGLAPCVKPAVEVFNNDTGRTTFIYEGTSNEADADEAGSSMVGLARGQVARLNIVNLGVYPPDPFFPPGPCRVTLTFVDVSGRVLSQVTKSVDFNRATFLDLSWSDLPPDPYHRLQVRALVGVEADERGNVPIVRPTLEIFSTDTGMATIYMLPAVQSILLPAVHQ
jgi:hypothetical protein